MKEKDSIRIMKSKRRNQSIAFWVLRVFSFSVVVILFVILGDLVLKGASSISWEFLSESPRNGMEEGGIFPAIMGTFYLVGGSMLVAFPIGIMAGIYMNEYARAGLLKRFIQVMTNNLAGVPSIVFGLFGMSLFVNGLGFKVSLLSGSLTLGLMVLPVVIRTTEEALKAIDDSFRIGSRAVGASRWQTTWRVVLPMAFPNIITGLILSIGRVSGETAPILFTAVVYFTDKLPQSIFDQVMALPYHLFELTHNGTDRDKALPLAYGTALVLVLIVLLVNLLANFLRSWFGKKVKMN
jgi:phosphate transport system permease protein